MRLPREGKRPLDNPRAEKAAIAIEVRERLADADAAILTEYRGLRVKELTALRRDLAPAGGDYRVYKNTLARLAVRAAGHEELVPLLEGPTAITFVNGDPTAVAKVLRDFSGANPLLVIKGAVLGDHVLGPGETTTLASLPSREVLLGQLAAALAAPLRQFAELLGLLPTDFARDLSALLQRRALHAHNPERPDHTLASDRHDNQPEQPQESEPLQVTTSPSSLASPPGTPTGRDDWLHAGQRFLAETSRSPEVTYAEIRVSGGTGARRTSPEGGVLTIFSDDETVSLSWSTDLNATACISVALEILTSEPAASRYVDYGIRSGGEWTITEKSSSTELLQALHEAEDGLPVTMVRLELARSAYVWELRATPKSNRADWQTFGAIYEQPSAPEARALFEKTAARSARTLEPHLERALKRP